MAENERIIRDFIAAWSYLNAKELGSFFREDGVYHNMPGIPVSGRDNIVKYIGNFIGQWTATDWEVLNVLEAGDLVVAERMDRTKLGDKSVNLPCCGVFEMRDGKIQVWRDYFDMATYVKAAS